MVGVDVCDDGIDFGAVCVARVATGSSAAAQPYGTSVNRAEPIDRNSLLREIVMLTHALSRYDNAIPYALFGSRGTAGMVFVAIFHVIRLIIFRKNRSCVNYH